MTIRASSVNRAEAVIVERSDLVATITINRPSVHNALDSQTLAWLAAEIERQEQDRRIRCVILTGAGDRTFSAGADLDELSGLSPISALEVMRSGQALMRRVETSTTPIVAAVNGIAVGGGFELVLASSFAVLATNATFALPEAKLGLIPGYGGTQRLSRAIGPAMARYTMLTGERIVAQRAYELGLAVVPPVDGPELLAAAHAVAAKVASSGPLACQAILRAVDRSLTWPLEAGLEYESIAAAMAVDGEESAEGIAAFKERRPARFGETDG